MFLETITIKGFEILIPIHRIRNISIAHEKHGYLIKIASDEGFHEETFFDKDAMLIRWKEIKEAVKCK